MTSIGLQAIQLQDATLIVEEDDYTASVNEVTIAPEVIWEWWERLSSPTVPVYLETRWTATIGYAQDLATPGSLTRYLLENAGAVRTLVFTPSAGGSSVSVEAMLVPGPIGGPSGQILTGTVTLPLFDAPVVDDGES